MDRPLSPPTELPEAVFAQIEDARQLLRGDAAAAGIPESLVEDAIARARDRFRDAQVHAFIGILVEREVRESLGLRARQPQDARTRAR